MIPMSEPFSHRRVAARIEAARLRSLDWFASMRLPGLAPGVHRISAAHDPARWPGVLLPGTYNALPCLDLIGGLDDWSDAARAETVDWLERHRTADGIFRIPGMAEADLFKKPDPGETRRYVDWHVTNYALAAIDALDPGLRPNLDFAAPWLDPILLKAWLADRDLRDPWQEGNNIVNLASFLLLLRRDGDAATGAKVATALDVLFDWHDRLQEPTTGFWGVGQLSDPTRLLHAFAGSMHAFHLWYHEDRPLEGQDRAIDYVLTLPPVVDSACIDVDAVDLLVHGHRRIDHRRAEIEAWLAKLLDALLDVQNPDGGFADLRDGVRRQDGWVGGYEEPQGLSNTFATWFRWIAIAMIAEILLPDLRVWRFRRTIGIGYRAADRRAAP